MKKLLVILVLLSLFSTSIYADQPSEWAEEAIEEMQERRHFSKDLFSDYHMHLTRLEFIEMVVSMYETLIGEEIVVNHEIAFVDTTNTFALKGATVGITDGVGEGRFAPDQLLNREELAVMVIRTLKLLEVDLEPAHSQAFSDDGAISSWAKEAIYLARSNNIISGVGNNLVDPKGPSSKQVGLVLVNRVLNENNGKLATNYKGERVYISCSTPVSFGEIKEVSELNIPEYGTDSIFNLAQGEYGTEYMAISLYLSETFVQFAYLDANRIYTYYDPIIETDGDVVTITARENGEKIIVTYNQAASYEGHLEMTLSIFGHDYPWVFHVTPDYDPKSFGIYPKEQ